MNDEYNAKIPKIYDNLKKKIKGVSNGSEFLQKLSSEYTDFDSFMNEQIHRQIEKGYLTGENGKREKLHFDFEFGKFYTNSGWEFNRLTYLNKRDKAIKKVVKGLMKKMIPENTNNYKEKNVQVIMNNSDNHYKHDLGGGEFLDAYSINPDKGIQDLERCVEGSLLETKSKSPINQEKLGDEIQKIGVYSKFSDMGLKFSFDKYLMPDQLHDHRDAISLGFSDSIIIFRDGKISSPGELIKGEYRDFVSTHLKRIPSNLVPNKYQQGKTIAELLKTWNLSREVVAKYFGFAHFMTPANGEELGFVYREPHLHIAPDCMALSGSTPKFPDQFNHKNFNIDTYFKNHLADEMMEEYCLKPNEFDIGKIHFMNDITEIPFAVIEINTPFSTKELAEKAYGQIQPMKEHSTLFSIKRSAIKSALEKFDFFPSTSRVIDLMKE